MRKLEVAVCDVCEGYLERFVAYLVEHKSEEMAVQAFSTPELFLKTIRERKFDAAILGSGFEMAAESVRAYFPCMVLTNIMPEQTAEELTYTAKDTELKTEVFRYQPMETIVHELQILTGAKQVCPAAGTALQPGMEVIGVCSPIRHEMQMPFSVVTASLLAEKQKVLYVNLMECSGFLEVFGLEGDYDMGDIIIRLRNQRLVPETFLRSVYETEGIYYIPPFSNPENLHELTLEDYLLFLEFLETKTDFEVVVIDFGEGLAQMAQMLERCGSVYCLVKAGFFYECQEKQFLEYLERVSAEELTERITRVELPFSAKHIRGGNSVSKQLLWSEFGDYVRNYLTGAAYESE